MLRFAFTALLFAFVTPALAAPQTPPNSDIWIDWYFQSYRQCLQGLVPFHPNCEARFIEAMRHVVAVVRSESK